MGLLLIGDDLREATDWLQDRMVVTRPIAERAMISLLREGLAITTNDGIFLSEDDEESVRRNTNSSVNNATHKPSRATHRARWKHKTQKSKSPKTDYSDEAQNMINAQKEEDL